MPRRSPFVIQLTEPERAELEARCKVCTSPHRDVIRAKIVLLASRGLGSKRLVRLVCVTGLTRAFAVFTHRRAETAWTLIVGEDRCRRPSTPNIPDHRHCSGRAASFCSSRRSLVEVDAELARAVRWPPPGSSARAPARRYG